MDPNELRLRNLLLDIGNKLSSNDRATLGFLLNNIVPRRVLDAIANDSRMPMSEVWDALIDQQKIAPDNVKFLITLLESIRRIDLVRQVEKYAATINPEELFKPYPPQD